MMVLLEKFYTRARAVTEERESIQQMTLSML